MKDVLYFVVQVLIVVLVILVTFYLYTNIRGKVERGKKTRQLQKLTLGELEQRVYRYETRYFQFLGEEKAPVIEFRKIIESKDVSTLYKKWDSFKASFLALDDHGRPALFDYYDGYELEVKELYERKK